MEFCGGGFSYWSLGTRAVYCACRFLRRTSNLPLHHPKITPKAITVICGNMDSMSIQTNKFSRRGEDKVKRHVLNNSIFAIASTPGTGGSV
jgi:hypothetical protein